MFRKIFKNSFIVFFIIIEGFVIATFFMDKGQNVLDFKELAFGFFVGLPVILILTLGFSSIYIRICELFRK